MHAPATTITQLQKSIEHGLYAQNSDLFRFNANTNKYHVYMCL